MHGLPTNPPEYNEALETARRISKTYRPTPRAWAAAWRIIEAR